MKPFGAFRVTILAAAALSAACGAGSEEGGKAVPNKPEVGSPAPFFSLTGSDGKLYRLEDYVGKQAVVVAWFPKAFTGG